MGILLLNILNMLVSVAALVVGIMMTASGKTVALVVVLIIIAGVDLCIVGPILFGGLKVLKPNEALVLTLFGKYIGTLKG